MAQAFVQPVWDIAKSLWAPIARRIHHARKLQENFQELCETASELCIKRDDINGKIDQLRVQKTPTKECEHWLAKVGEMENKIETIKQEFNVEKKCLRGLCPDIFALIGLGERVVKMIGEVKDLLEKHKSEDAFFTDLPAIKVEKQPVPTILTPSAHNILKMVVNKIQDNSTPKIGIWGKGGIGKTTIMKLLNNTPEITTIFDFVIWVTVSKSSSIRQLQEKIGTRLSIKIESNESNETVASKLSRVLESKKYLLLLDDVWEMVDLSVVGLPDANQDNDCKVVLTTRQLGVCRRMRTNIEINVAVLSEEEAREMFYPNVGDVAMRPIIGPVAEEIIRECAGLPLALKVVSGALRKEENHNVWRNFLAELKAPATLFNEEMNEEVFKPLKVSYDHLKDTMKKKCFLYCGLYPEDDEIKKSRLINYWRAEGLLSGKFTLAEAHVRGDAILQALINSSLLERCESDYYVKVHDVVRDMVLTMTSPKGEEGKHLVRAGISTEEMPEVEEWKKATRISFMDHELRNLPESPDCPILLTLLLQNNWELEAIPESFFNKMPRLRVLDLSRTKIKSLPTYICNLVNLQELLLKRCFFLEVLPEEVSALRGLEVLQVTDAMIAHLPLWILKMTALKCLKFWPKSDMEWPKAVGDIGIGERQMFGLISRCSQIEVFEVPNFVYDVGARDETSIDIVVKELSSLIALSSLEFDFGSISNLQHFLENSKPWRDKRLTKFRFIVCGENSRTLVVSGRVKLSKKCVKYRGGEGSILPRAILDVLSRSDGFALEDHRKLHSLSELRANTSELRYFTASRCAELETFIDRNGIQMDIFPKLEVLKLIGLLNLRCILGVELEGPPLAPPESVNSSCFTNLRTLEIWECHRIKKLFSSGFMIRQLSNLETLSIIRCEGVEGMISEDNDEIVVEYYGALPKLKYVDLLELPEFDSFFKGVPMCWPSLLRMTIYGCPKLRKLPFDINSGAALKVIQCGRKWWEALEWDDNAIQLRLQPFVF